MMTDSQKNRPPKAPPSQVRSEQAAAEEDIIMLDDEVLPTEKASSSLSPAGDDADEEVLTLTDELALDDGPDMDPGQSPDEDVVTLTDEITFDEETEDDPGQSQEEDVINLTDEVGPDAEPDDGLAESQDQEIISLTDEFSVDADAAEALGESQDADVISLTDPLSADQAPDPDPWENQEHDLAAVSGDPAAEPADQLPDPADEAAGSSDETSDMLDQEIAGPDSKTRKPHNVTDTIDLSAKKQAASLSHQEILPLTDDPGQEVIVLDEDIDLKASEITDDIAGQDAQDGKPDAAAKLYDFGLRAALTDENHDQSDAMGSEEVELAEIAPLDEIDGLDSDAVLDQEIVEVVEFDEDPAEPETPARGQTDAKADDGLLFDDDAPDVVNVEDLEAESDDSEIDNLIQDFFEDETPAADSQDTDSESPPDTLTPKTRFPDHVFDDDEFKFTVETKDISDQIDRLADPTSEQPVADAPPIFPLGADFRDALKSVKETDFPAISEAALDAAVQRVIERNFSTRIETMIGQAIEKAVSQEIAKLKRLLLDQIGGEDAD